jgi:hypothetical protein
MTPSDELPPRVQLRAALQQLKEQRESQLREVEAQREFGFWADIAEQKQCLFSHEPQEYKADADAGEQGRCLLGACDEVPGPLLVLHYCGNNENSPQYACEKCIIGHLEKQHKCPSCRAPVRFYFNARNHRVYVPIARRHLEQQRQEQVQADAAIAEEMQQQAPEAIEIHSSDEEVVPASDDDDSTQEMIPVRRNLNPLLQEEGQEEEGGAVPFRPADESASPARVQSPYASPVAERRRVRQRRD